MSLNAALAVVISWITVGMTWNAKMLPNVFHSYTYEEFHGSLTHMQMAKEGN